MAFTELKLIDAFQRAENPLAGPWKVIFGLAATGKSTLGEPVALSGYTSTVPFSSGENAAFWSREEFIEPIVAAKLAVLGGNVERKVRLWACLENPTEASKTGYFVEAEEEAVAGKFKVTLQKFSGEAASVLATATARALPAGTRIAIQVRNGRVTAWYQLVGEEWAKLLEVVDNSYTKGFVGIAAK